LISKRKEVTARFLLIDKKGFACRLVCLSINKNEHPKGFGALEDCPNKINSGKCCNFSLQLLPNRLFLQGDFVIK